MSWLLGLAFSLNTAPGPVDLALQATEVPEALRAAFTVELYYGSDRQTYSYDPRRSSGDQWRLIEAEGENRILDSIFADWASETTPDGRLFATSLREDIGEQFAVDDLGHAWRVRFDHEIADPARGGPEQLQGRAWLEPATGRFMRLDFSLADPVERPDGSQLTRFDKSYRLEQEQIWGLSYIAEYQISAEISGPEQARLQAYRAVISEASFFYASAKQQDEPRNQIYSELIGN